MRSELGIYTQWFSGILSASILRSKPGGAQRILCGAGDLTQGHSTAAICKTSA